MPILITTRASNPLFLKIFLNDDVFFFFFFFNPLFAGNCPSAVKHCASRIGLQDSGHVWLLEQETEALAKIIALDFTEF